MINGGSGMGIGWVFGFLILAIIVGLLIRGLCVNRLQSRRTPGEDDAFEILRKRYAKGEISEEEFEHKKKELENSL